MERTVFAELWTVSAQTWSWHNFLKDLILVCCCVVFSNLREKIESLWVGEVWIFYDDFLFDKGFIKALITNSLKYILLLNAFLSYRIHKGRDWIQSLNEWAFGIIWGFLIMTFGKRNQVWGWFGRIFRVHRHETIDVDIIFGGNYRIFHGDQFCWTIVSERLKLLFLVLGRHKEPFCFFWQLVFYSFSLDVVRFTWGRFRWNGSWLDRYVHFQLSGE